jgi:hypothetical protein
LGQLNKKRKKSMSRFLKARAYWLSIGLFLGIFALQAQSACIYFDEFKDNNDGTVTDPRSKLIWQKCAVGQAWLENTCKKDAKDMDWSAAFDAAKSDLTAGKNDWRLPTKEELLQVVGKPGECEVRAASKQLSYSVKSNEKLGVFWSSTKQDSPYLTSFENGYTFFNSRYLSNGNYARLVRSNDPNNLAQFNYDHHNAKAQNEVHLSLQNQFSDAELLRRNQIIEEKLFNALIINKNPQTMYLAAGDYQRKDDVSRSWKIYEAIISRFPNSSWAVKANDQLNDSKRSIDAQSAVNQRQYDAQRATQDAASKARSQCSYRIDKCEDSCRPLSGSSKSACWSSCKSLCNQF